jgi:hypothetical protein
MERWMDGWLDGWTDRRAYIYIYIYIYSRVNVDLKTDVSEISVSIFKGLNSTLTRLITLEDFSTFIFGGNLKCFYVSVLCHAS